MRYRPASTLHVSAALRAGQRYWIHLDIDVLDHTVMPAVDSPGLQAFYPTTY